MWRGIMVLEAEMEVNEEYVTLTDRFLSDFDSVPDSLENFVAGLEDALDKVNERLELARADVRRKNKGK